MGYDLRAPASEKKTERVKNRLRAADATPSLMHRAVDEAKRAAEDGQSAREWFEAVQRRAYSEEIAEMALARGRSRLNEEPPAEDGDPGKPPSAEQVFAFLLAWEALGGTSGVAAARELLRRSRGNLPSN